VDEGEIAAQLFAVETELEIAARDLVDAGDTAEEFERAAIS